MKELFFFAAQFFVFVPFGLLLLIGIMQIIAAFGSKSIKNVY